MTICTGRKYADDFIVEAQDMEKAISSAIEAIVSSLPKTARRYDVIKDVLVQTSNCLERIPIEFFPSNK